MSDNSDPAYPCGEMAGYPAYSGMSLRDYFAGQALSSLGLKSDGCYSTHGRKHKEPEKDAEWIATAAYRYADVMLAERKKS